MSFGRKKSTRFFEIFVEFIWSKGNITVGTVYPPDYAEDELMEKIKKMCFPCPYRPANVECFSFVLTDIDASRRYGHVRLSERGNAQQALCLVTKLGWFDAFYRFLNVIGGILVRTVKNDPLPLIKRAYSESARIMQCAPSDPFELASGDTDVFTFCIPSSRPTLKESRILSEYFSTLRPITMVRVFAHMLHERRILFVSRRLSRLTCCIHAAVSLIYPFSWQHLFIPVLPDTLIDYLQAPMPFVIGVHQDLFERAVRSQVELGDCCVVMLDTSSIASEYDDLLALPDDLVTYFRRALQLDKSELRGAPPLPERSSDKERDREKTDRSDLAANCDALSTIFLRAMVLCVGDYREYLLMLPGEPVSFDEERFIAEHRADPSGGTSSSNSRFYDTLRSLQMFQQFIDDRLVRIVNNSVLAHAHIDDQDPFEVEAHAAHKRADDTDRRYNAWMAASRDRLADLAVKMKSKSKELRKRFREDLRKSQMAPVRPGVNNTLSNSHFAPPITVQSVIGTDESTIERRKPPRPPPPTGFVPLTADNVNAGKPVATPPNEIGVDWAPPAQGGALLEDPLIKELLNRQVSTISLDNTPTRPNSVTVAKSDVVNHDVQRNSTGNLLLLDFGDTQVAQSTSSNSLSLLDQFDPLASGQPQLLPQLLAQSTENVTLRTRSTRPAWRENAAQVSGTDSTSASSGTESSISGSPYRISVAIPSGNVRSLAASFSQRPRPAPAQPSNAGPARAQPNVTLFPTNSSMAAWHLAAQPNYRANAQPAARLSGMAPVQTGNALPKGDDLIGL